jgi:CubicO group peptidase (beta-lactamase class C family)
MKKQLLLWALLTPFALLSQTVDTKALDILIENAKQTHSSALVVYHNDKQILNQCFDSAYMPLDAMSATKSFVNLGIGLLITQGKLKSIDEPVYSFYPEWNQGMKKEITIRHLLNHTSGLKALRGTTEIYGSPDYVQLALCAELADKPGTNFFYNNEAVNLLAGIIQKASGIRMDKYIDENIFKPLGIVNYQWWTDAYLFNARKNKKGDSTLFNVGNPIGMAELIIKADDMAKAGLLALHKGNWQGKQIINESWFDESFKPGQTFDQTCGLLWWLIYDPLTSYVTFTDSNIVQLQQINLSDTLIAELKNIKGRYKTPNAFFDAIDSLPYLKKIGGRNAFANLLSSKSFFKKPYNFHTENSKIIGFAARGYLGQFINIFPDKKLVVVRTIWPRNSKGPEDNFSNFDILSYQLVK